jgi:Transglutaminase-like superfamily
MVAGRHHHRMLISLLRSVRRRSPTERRALAVAVAVVVAVRVALTVVPSRWIIGVVRRLSQRSSLPRAVRRRSTVMSNATIVWAVEAASRFVPRANCLTQALAAQIMLQRHGHSATLCLGVQRTPARPFRAHAWLELNGEIILGGEESRLLARLSSLTPADTPPIHHFSSDVDRAAGMVG